MINTYVLMITGILMVGAGCLFLMAKSIKEKERGDFPIFLIGVIFCLILLFTLRGENNVFVYNHPLVIVARIVIFILGLMMIFAVSFPCDPVMDKIEAILDKFRPDITAKIDKRFLAILITFLAIVSIAIIMAVKPM